MILSYTEDPPHGLQVQLGQLSDALFSAFLLQWANRRCFLEVIGELARTDDQRTVLAIRGTTIPEDFLGFLTELLQKAQQEVELSKSEIQADEKPRGKGDGTNL